MKDIIITIAGKPNADSVLEIHAGFEGEDSVDMTLNGNPSMMRSVYTCLLYTSDAADDC